MPFFIVGGCTIPLCMFGVMEECYFRRQLRVYRDMKDRVMAVWDRVQEIPRSNAAAGNWACPACTFMNQDYVMVQQSRSVSRHIDPDGVSRGTIPTPSPPHHCTITAPVSVPK